MHVPGVAENFTDELDLVGALLLKWHARLSGNIERALMREPMDLESAVAAAWRTTAEQLPGVRLVIDRCTERPPGPEMERAMDRAREREWARPGHRGRAGQRRRPAAVAGRPPRRGAGPDRARPERAQAPSPPRARHASTRAFDPASCLRRPDQGGPRTPDPTDLGSHVRTTGR